MTHQWKTICTHNDLVNNSGICALLNGQQVAIFKTQIGQESRLYAINNWDPVGQANVLYRGLLGSSDDQVFVASPLYKQRYCVETGRCLDDKNVNLQTYEVRAQDELVQIKVVS